MAEPKAITDTANMFMELFLYIGPALVTASCKTQFFIGNRVPKTAIHRQLNCHHLRCGLLDLKREKAGGRANLQYPFSREVVSAQVFIETSTQIPLPFNQTYARDICAVVEITLIDSGDYPRRFIKLASLSLCRQALLMRDLLSGICLMFLTFRCCRPH